MAPENLPFGFHDGKLVSIGHKHSSQGDVWAFGVVLFEIWTKGEFPFGGLTDKEVRPRLFVYFCDDTKHSAGFGFKIAGMP